ncbi:MAG: hypothetical protein NZT92_01090 [Abditibacteriales bacterium]|nr:hypothetical protein [Abditibacteriales bacterium]MDW8364414.1 hypothetical protein [Abditibacteriales bacterium]
MRSGPLADGRLISLVQTDFVPVAINQLRVRERKDAEGDLFRLIRQQNNTYQGLWFVTPDGKVLGQVQSRYSDANLQAARAALEKWKAMASEPAKPLPGRVVHPFDGLPPVAEGSLRLAVFVRRLNSVGGDGFPAYDHVDLTADEWRSFIPTEARVGSRRAVSQSALRKIALTFWPEALSDPIRPGEIKSVALTATLTSVANEEWTVELSGKVHIDGSSAWGNCPRRTYHATLRGALRYRPPEQRLTALRLIADGSWHVATSFGNLSTSGRLGVVVEFHSSGD